MDTNTHNLCFGAKIREVYPCIPQFYYRKVGFKGIHGHVFLMLYRPVCVGPGRLPRRPVFSRRGSCHIRERGSVVVDHRTPNQEELSSIPTGGTVCP